MSDVSVLTAINTAWLFLAAEVLSRRFPGQRIGFLSRDCQLLHKIYARHFNANCEYVPFSRLASLNKELAANYLKSFNCDVLVDISSTGKTWQRLGYPVPVHALIYSDVHKYAATSASHPPSFTWTVQNSVIGNTTAVVELVNCADHGSLVNLRPFTFAPPDMSPELIQCLHLPVRVAVEVPQDSVMWLVKGRTDEELLAQFTWHLLYLSFHTSIFADPVLAEWQRKQDATTRIIKRIFDESDQNRE